MLYWYWQNTTEYNFLTSAGYGERNKKRNWWSHCSSQGRNHYWSCSFEMFFFLFLVVAFVCLQFVYFSISRETLWSIFNFLTVYCFLFFNISRKAQCPILLNSLPMYMLKVLESRYSLFPFCPFILFVPSFLLCFLPP